MNARPRRPPADPIVVARAVRAIAASFATGIAIYWLVIVVALPRLDRALRAADRARLRDSFRAHPYAVPLVILAVALVLAAPVPIVFRAVYGPLRSRKTGVERLPHP